MASASRLPPRATRGKWCVLMWLHYSGYLLLLEVSYNVQLVFLRSSSSGHSLNVHDRVYRSRPKDKDEEEADEKFWAQAKFSEVIL